MKGLLIFAAVLGVLALSNVTAKSIEGKIECYQRLERAQTRIYENQIKELIHNLVNQLKAGIPEQNIPPMDPLILDNTNILFDQDFANLDATFTGDVVGLTAFDISKLTLSLAGFKFTFGFHFPAITANGKYSISGNIAELLPIYGSGNLDATVHDLRIEGNGKIGSKGTGEEQAIFLENFSINVAMDSLDFKATGLLNDDGLSALLSKLVAESVPDMINEFAADINSTISNVVTQQVDKLLDGKTLKDIIDIITGKSTKVLLDCDDY